jgi:hypothetical protein
MVNTSAALASVIVSVEARSMFSALMETAPAVELVVVAIADVPLRTRRPPVPPVPFRLIVPRLSVIVLVV